MNYSSTTLMALGREKMRDFEREISTARALKQAVLAPELQSNSKAGIPTLVRLAKASLLYLGLGSLLLVSSASDLVTFANARPKDKWESRETLLQMAQPVGTDVDSGILWGLGGGTLKQLGVGAYGMGSDIPGFQAFFMGFLDNNLLVVSVTNTEEGDVVGPSLRAVDYLAAQGPMQNPQPKLEGAAPTATLTPKAVLERLFTSETLDPAWFSDSFLAVVPVPQFEYALTRLKNQLGTFERVEGEVSPFTVVLERGTLQAEIGLDSEGHIVGWAFFQVSDLRGEWLPYRIHIQANSRCNYA